MGLSETEPRQYPDNQKPPNGGFFLFIFVLLSALRESGLCEVYELMGTNMLAQVVFYTPAIVGFILIGDKAGFNRIQGKLREL